MAVNPPDRVQEDDLLELYRLKVQPKWFSSQHTTAFMRSIMEQLRVSPSSCSTLRSLATIKYFSLSIQFFGSEEKPENLGILEEMKAIITKPVDLIDHRVQVEQKLLSELFAAGAMQMIDQKVTLRPGHSQKDVEEQLANIQASILLRDCFGGLLEATLDLPLRRELHLGLYLKSLEGILRHCDQKDLDLVSSTIFHPFSEQGQLLQRHLSRMGLVNRLLKGGEEDEDDDFGSLF